MDINQITLYRMNMKLKNPFKTSYGTTSNKDFFIIEVNDADGRSGWGESVAFSAPWYTGETTETVFYMMREFLIPLLFHSPVVHPDEVSRRFEAVRKNPMAKAALEGAVWDLYAKKKNVSLACALGGTKQAVDVGISIGLQQTDELLFERIRSALRQGYQRVKLKIKPGQDVELLDKVRGKFPDISLMADANSAYRIEDALHLARFDQYNLMMIEQPFRQDDLSNHALLQKRLKTPICLDESIDSPASAESALRIGAGKVINLKIGRVGGLTAARQIHDLAYENHMDLWCGGMLEAGIGRAHSAAISSLPGFTMPGDTAGSDNYWVKDIVSPAFEVHDGRLDVPDGPGIGVTVDREAIDFYQTDKFTFKSN